MKKYFQNLKSFFLRNSICTNFCSSRFLWRWKRQMLRHRFPISIGKEGEGESNVSIHMTSDSIKAQSHHPRFQIPLFNALILARSPIRLSANWVTIERWSASTSLEALWKDGNREKAIKKTASDSKDFSCVQMFPQLLRSHVAHAVLCTRKAENLFYWEWFLSAVVL